MAIMLERVNRRKLALAAEYGAEAGDVIADSFTDEYFDTISRPIRPDSDADRVRVEYPPMAQGDLMRYRVFWFDRDRQRAGAAINEDWEETIAPARSEQARAELAVKAPRAGEHWRWAEARRARFGDEGCVCTTCEIFAAL